MRNGPDDDVESLPRDPGIWRRAVRIVVVVIVAAVVVAYVVYMVGGMPSVESWLSGRGP